MKRLKILAFVLITLTFKVSAESFVYITDQLDLPIRSDKNFGNNIIRLLPSGTELSLLQSTEDGWAQPSSVLCNKDSSVPEGRRRIILFPKFLSDLMGRSS